MRTTDIIIKTGAFAAIVASGLFALTESSFAQTASAELIEKGRMVATGSDCMACHTVPHTGQPFAGGYGIISPLGTIYSTNITPSKTAGIGNYSEADFSRAVRQGIRKDGGHLYPAMPYNAYAEMTDADINALYTYFMNGVKPVDAEPKDYTALPFPFNLRFSMAFWNILYANKTPFKPDPAKSDDLNRGAYIAGALGHCASCHTPRGPLMGADSGANLAGGFVGPWYAPNITSDPVSGIGGWSEDELVQYFRTGHADGKNQAAGGMAEAVQNSLQFLPDSDLLALARYLKTVRAVRDPADKRPAHEFGTTESDEANIRGMFASNEHDSLRNGGAELYSGYCASCHQPNGAGSENQAYPSLFHNTATGASRPANLVAAILYGVERKTGEHDVLMPSFGEKSYVMPLNDQQVADISNYVLTKFGNPEAKVTPADVAVARKGGPVPLLAKAQPFILPAMIIAALVVLILAGVLFFVTRRERVPRQA
ncbi:mono/diheme cytochrome c family protein [Neorhizobium alkalisoli]|uniref:Mono/diheme cytochrome c family protein n=2 Tax=Neorhizobium alkalisoli TaxID=528178 RepID=A0A561R702_9HYPH|nr:mono/diheme cytochrome c family protein [Neorhizobium alkalisoli]